MNTTIRIFGKGEDRRIELVLDGHEGTYQNKVTISVIKDTNDLDSGPTERTTETKAITISNDLAKSLLLALQKYLF